MDFGLSEEQRLLEQTLRRWLAEQVPVARVREIAARDDAAGAALWQGLAELGVLGLLVPEAHGGGGLAMLDAALAMQSLALLRLAARDGERRVPAGPPPAPRGRRRA